MNKKTPIVSIGIPVFNGEKYLREALDSLVNQTFKEFEIIISDNASTDATEEICREYASKDNRIRYYKNRANIGPAKNFNSLVKLARGKYFKWAAHDDICAPEFLERCVAILEHNDAVVLCYPKARVINENGQTREEYNLKIRTSSPKAYERFHDLICVPHRCYQVFGMIRTSVLKMTPLIASYAGSDRTLLARLALLGEFYEIPEYLFLPRRHAQQSIEMLYRPKQRHKRMHHYAVWFDPANQGKILLPNWRIVYEYFIAINQTPLSGKEKIGCYVQLVAWLFTYWNFAKLFRDLLIAFVEIVGIWLSSRKRTNNPNDIRGELV